MNGPVSFDEPLFSLLHVGLGHPLLDPLMVALTVLAPAIVLAVAAKDLVRGDRRAAAIVVVTAVLACLVAVLLQFAAMRPRPEIVRAVMGPPSFPSFPSGHAAIAGAVAAIVALRTPRWAVAAIGLALAIGVSRVYLGHHYPSDVLVGLAVGAGTGAYAYGTFHADPSVRPRWTWWLFPLGAVMFVATANAYLGLYRMENVMRYGGDKPIHFLLFGGASFFLVSFFRRFRPRTIIAVLAVLTIAEEISQAYSPMRCFDLYDLACSLSGVIVCGFIASQMRRELGPGKDVVEVRRNCSLA